MVKVKSWLFTEVRGKVKKAEFRRRKNKVTELSQKRIPFNPRTEKQQEVRKTYGKCVEEWNKLSESEKREWRIIGTLQGISGYNAFMRECMNERLGKIWYEITIDNSANAEDLTDYQVLLEIVNDSTFFEDCKNEQKYLEFYDTDKATLLKHFVEEFDTTNKNAKIWIKVPSIPANSTKTIYLKINTSRTSDLSNPNEVFEFYDDFEGDALDTNKWNLVKGEEGSNVFVENGELKVTSNAVLIQSVQSFSQGYLLESKHRVISHAGYGHIIHGFRETTSKNAEHLIWATGNRLYADGSEINGDYAVPTDTYLLYQVKVKDNTAKAEIYDMSGNQKESLSGTSTFSSAVISLVERPADYQTHSGDFRWDWIRVRKYTEPEPSVSYTKL